MTLFMSTEALEFAIIVIGGLIIVGAVSETCRLLIRRAETRRSRFLEEGRLVRWLRDQAPHDDGEARQR